MSRIIELEVSHPGQGSGPIQGFRFLWAYYVTGYHPSRHCQPCFRGRRVVEFCTPTARVGRSVRLDRMDRFPFVYVCGVGSGPRRELAGRNLHFPLRYAEGAVARVETYNGYRFVARNAELLPIPPLPRGWRGLDEEHTRCKNFQFAVAYFGEPPQAAND